MTCAFPRVALAAFALVAFVTTARAERGARRAARHRRRPDVPVDPPAPRRRPAGLLGLDAHRPAGREGHERRALARRGPGAAARLAAAGRRHRARRRRARRARAAHAHRGHAAQARRRVARDRLHGQVRHARRRPVPRVQGRARLPVHAVRVRRRARGVPVLGRAGLQVPVPAHARGARRARGALEHADRVTVREGRLEDHRVREDAAAAELPARDRDRAARVHDRSRDALPDAQS